MGRIALTPLSLLLVVSLGGVPGAGAAGAGDADEIGVNVRAVALEGVAAASENELLSLVVELSPTLDGYVAPEEGLPVERVPLWTFGRRSPEGTTLRGSALQAVVAAIADEYAARGLAGTRVDITTRGLREAGDDGLLVIRVTEASYPAAPADVDDAEILGIELREIVFEGVSGKALLEQQILDLPIELSRLPGGWVAARPDLPQHRVTLSALLQTQGRSVRFSQSVLQQVLNVIGQAYDEVGLPETRVRIRQHSLERVTSPGGDGVLVIEVAEQSSGS